MVPPSALPGISPTSGETASGTTFRPVFRFAGCDDDCLGKPAERALVATLAEMYVQGVSTRKVKAITEELCGHAFSASSISAINKRLDESLTAFACAPASRAVSLSHPRCPLREGARGRRRHEPGGADRRRHRLGRPAARSWPWRWPTARAARPGRTSSLGLEGPRPQGRRVRSSPTIMPACVAAIGEVDPGSRLAALLCALPAQCARSSAAQARAYPISPPVGEMSGRAEGGAHGSPAERGTAPSQTATFSAYSRNSVSTSSGVNSSKWVMITSGSRLETGTSE